MVSAAVAGTAPGRILRTLFTLGPMSRADLTRATNMSRSTVGGALTDLHRWGVVDSTMPDEFARAGRPSASVEVVAESVYSVVLDISARSIRHSIMRLDGSLEEPQIIDLEEHDPAHVTALVTDIMQRRQAEATGQCVGVGVSLPGIVSSAGVATLVLPLGWERVRFRDQLAQALGPELPVVVAQDALHGAKAEFVWGAGADLHRMLYLIARDHGVGGAVVGTGLHEPNHPLQAGHIQVRTDGNHCECGSSGCLETYIDADAVRNVLQTAGLPTSDLAEGVRTIAGSSERESFINDVVEPLRVGLITLVNALGPDGVVLGGGLKTLAEVFFPELELAVAQTVVARVREVPLRRGAAHDPILKGCGLAAYEALFLDPRESGINYQDRYGKARR